MYRDECSHHRRALPACFLSGVFCVQKTQSYTYLCFNTFWQRCRSICLGSGPGRWCTHPRRAYSVLHPLPYQVLNSTKTSTLHPAVSRTLGPSTSFACPPATRTSCTVVGTRKCTSYAVLDSGPDVQPEGKGKTVAYWEEDLSGGVASSGQDERKTRTAAVRACTAAYESLSSACLLVSSFDNPRLRP